METYVPENVVKSEKKALALPEKPTDQKLENFQNIRYFNDRN